ncbi:hypothetical protein V7654_03085 [Bacillus sp. JJ1609]|uniref:hypothetical protein n=1 Tax=Bacillus sp. JJ1609 TaxID=3122977 RepID=UPI002FFF6686
MVIIEVLKTIREKKTKARGHNRGSKDHSREKTEARGHNRVSKDHSREENIHQWSLYLTKLFFFKKELVYGMPKNGKKKVW